jgi:transketolase
METFGASGKGSEVYKHFGFDADKIVEKIKGN